MEKNNALTISNYYQPPLNPNFIGRDREISRLKAIDDAGQAAIIVVSGRRRIGKTELIEQFYRTRPMLKFEGLQPEVTRKRSFKQELKRQISNACERLATYTGQKLIAKLSLDTWGDFFKVLLPLIETSEVILYFEELQWLANYSDDFTAQLKPLWDDHLRRNTKLRIVFSGSAPSFLTKQFLRSSALYSRSNHTLLIKQFSLNETAEFLGDCSLHESCRSLLTLGGVPAYLKLISQHKGLIPTLCAEAFDRNGFLYHEYQRIFVSGMAHNKHYLKIVEYLATKKYATRDEIAKMLGVAASGGLSAVLKDLEECEFIEIYAPLHKGPHAREQRYAIRDAFLAFYTIFIGPKRTEIQFDDSPGRFEKYVDNQRYIQSLGYAFERWCRQNPYTLARCMRFDQVSFKSGSYYSPALDTAMRQPGFQIDLAFLRADMQLVLCEIKYSMPRAPSTIAERLRQVGAQLQNEPRLKLKKHSVRYALIVAEEIADKTEHQAHFDYVVDLKDLTRCSI